MEFADLVNEYGLLVVLSGFAACVLCGIVKIPIVRYIRSLNLGEKTTTDRIRNVCTAIVAFVSIVTIAVYRCVAAASAESLAKAETYLEMLSAITFAKIAYGIYEGIGPVSIKKGVKLLVSKIFNKAEELPVEEKDSVQDWVDITQAALTDVLHMPLTDAQKETLSKTLRGESSNEES